MHLIIAGKGDMESEIREKITNYKLSDYIKMAGNVQRDKIPDYYGAADVYIIASDYEGTSLSLLEAMFNKLIIIGSDASGINKMLKHGKNALLYPTTDIAAMSEAIKQAFSNKTLSKSLSQQAFDDFKQAYAYEPMMEKYREIFSSVTF
jgi:glycosyltransferase involved in cell wall biosynthesis